MPDSFNFTIFINPAGNASGEYLVELRDGEKTIAQVKTRIDRQTLLPHEHAFNARDYGMELYETVFAGTMGERPKELLGRISKGIGKVQAA